MGVPVVGGQDVASGCVGRNGAGTAQRKDGADELAWAPGAAAQPLRVWQRLLQRSNHWGLAP